MKPTSLQTRDRVRQSQQEALDAILLAHEKEGREFGYQTFGGPLLNETDILSGYDEMVQSRVGRYAVVDAPIPLWRRLLRRIR